MARFVALFALFLCIAITLAAEIKEIKEEGKKITDAAAAGSDLQTANSFYGFGYPYGGYYGHPYGYGYGHPYGGFYGGYRYGYPFYG